VLAAMTAGVAKAELAKQRREFPALVFVDGEFDEADAAAARLRLQRGGRSARRRLAELILEQDQRTQPVSRGANRRAGAKLVVEDFQRQRAFVPGRAHGFHEARDRQVALPWEAAEMPAAGQH